MLSRIHFSLAALVLAFVPGLRAEESYDPGRFEKEVLVSASRDALQFEVLPDGDIVFAEFWGDVKRWSAKTGEVKKLGHVPAYAKGEVGLLGMAVAPDFLKTGHLYALFCPSEKQGTMRVSRFTVEGDTMAAESERQLLAWPYDTEHVFHMGGAMFMDAGGDLYIGNGDNCHWNPGLPLDFRPGRKSWDALRSAGNSRDLRGKILRIHPTNEGGYGIPEGNLFPGGKDGAPEVFAMGVRNPFRMTVDPATGVLYFGDVGPNVMPVLGIEPAGYEEINATKVAGNFGWPLFIGPNEAFPLFDFDANKPLQKFDPASPKNLSPNNTGIKDLPPAIPALIWYSTTPSKEFPTLGSGGRSIMAGPVYHFDEKNPSAIKLPKALDGRLFIYEWMRNWIQTVDLASAGPKIEPFLPKWNLRRPIDMKLGSDGALYWIEYGDRWWENSDSRIVRVVYRRGNRPPVAALMASETAGRQPLAITFDASGSADPDGDALKFAWRVAGEEMPGSGSTFSHTFEKKGSYEVSLTASDPAGASSTTTRMIQVGNARPEVRFVAPENGSFFDWGAKIPYKVTVADPDSATIDLANVAVHGEFRSRRFLADGGTEAVDARLALMRGSTCFACHLSNAPSAGPPYVTVALKYKGDTEAPDKLARKILSGGTGVWGQLPMPPHPQHTIGQTRQMVDWILSLSENAATPPQPGAEGVWTAPKQPGRSTRTDQGVLILTAGYSDAGADGAPPLRGESAIILHSRRKKAALYDFNRGMRYVEQVEGEADIIGHFSDGDYIIFRDLNLDGIKRVLVRAGSLTAKAGRIEMRRATPDGALLASVEVKPTGNREFDAIPVELPANIGLTDLCVLARLEGKDEVLGLNWIEFQQ